MIFLRWMSVLFILIDYRDDERYIGESSLPFGKSTPKKVKDVNSNKKIRGTNVGASILRRKINPLVILWNIFVFAFIFLDWSDMACLRLATSKSAFAVFGQRSTMIRHYWYVSVNQQLAFLFRLFIFVLGSNRYRTISNVNKVELQDTGNID